jgi:hypothetical protein
MATLVSFRCHFGAKSQFGAFMSMVSNMRPYKIGSILGQIGAKMSSKLGHFGILWGDLGSLGSVFSTSARYA